MQRLVRMQTSPFMNLCDETQVAFGRARKRLCLHGPWEVEGLVSAAGRALETAENNDENTRSSVGLILCCLQSPSLLCEREMELYSWRGGSGVLGPLKITCPSFHCSNNTSNGMYVQAPPYVLSMPPDDRFEGQKFKISTTNTGANRRKVCQNTTDKKRVHE
jgi:hypothetical protein